MHENGNIGEVTMQLIQVWDLHLYSWVLHDKTEGDRSFQYGGCYTTEGNMCFPQSCDRTSNALWGKKFTYYKFTKVWVQKAGFEP